MARAPLKKLGPQHEVFCLHRVAGMRIGAAYLAAGMGRTLTQAKKDGWALEQDPLIAARLKALWEVKFKQLHMSTDEILARTAMLARTDAADILDADGCIENVADLPREASVQIAGIEVIEEFAMVGKKRVKVGQRTKVRLREPMAALRLLAEHKKLVKAPEEGLNALAGAIADRLKAARERKRQEPSK